MSTTYRHNPLNRSGSAALIAVIALAFMSLVAFAALETAMNENRAAHATVRSAEAMFAAEAGLNSVLGNWPDVLFVDVAAGDSLDMGWTTLPNGARYRTVIRRYDDGAMQQMRAIKVEAQGTGPLDGRGVLWVWTTVPILHTAAVNAGGDIIFRGGAISDAYDSREGDYGTSTIYDEGHLMTNGDVTVNGSGTTVSGSASASGTVDQGAGTIIGSVTNGADPVEYPPMPCPTSGYTQMTDLPLTSGVTLAVNGALSMSNANLVLPAGTYYFSSISMSGNSMLQPAAGATVDIFVSGGISISGQGKINNTNRNAGDFTFYGCGNSVDTWKMASGNEGYFSVYAPYKDMQLSGGNAVYGAMTVGTFDNAGGASLHFDKALLANNHRGMIMSRSWTQLAR